MNKFIVHEQILKGGLSILIAGGYKGNPACPDEGQIWLELVDGHLQIHVWHGKENPTTIELPIAEAGVETMFRCDQCHLIHDNSQKSPEEPMICTDCHERSIQASQQAPKDNPPHRDYWEDDPDYPASDWQYEVANGDTRQSYWKWVESKREG